MSADLFSFSEAPLGVFFCSDLLRAIVEMSPPLDRFPLRNKLLSDAIIEMSFPLDRFPL